MADRAGEEYLVETDFLFGLRAGDKLHEHVTRALAKCRRGELKIAVLSSAIVEARAVLYARGLEPGQVETVLALMDAALAEHGVRDFVQVELADVVFAERLRVEHPSLGFFDSLHAAVAARRRRPLLTADKAYEEVGLDVRSLYDF